MKHFLILLVALFAMEQISADPAPIFKKFKAEKKSGTFITKPLFTGLQISKGENDFDIVSIKDCPLTDIVGAPQMPVKYMHFLIPPGKDVASIKIKKKSYNLPGKYKIMPVQPPCYPCENWKPLPFVWPDARYYKYTPVFPEKIAEVVHHGYFDGRARIVTIAVHPLQYITGRDLLVYHDKLSFQFTYRDSGPDDQPLQVRNRKPELQAKYDTLLNTLIDNDDKSDLRFYVPSDSTDTGTKPEVMDYLIIAPEEYLGPDDHYFDDLVNWKRAKGLNVTFKSLQSIYNEYNGDQAAGDLGIPDSTGSIRQYLKEQWQNGLVYALLVGDNTVFPIRYGCGYTDNGLPQPPDRDNYIVPADLYFADFNGKWNVDGDEYYGEPHDPEDLACSDYPDYYCEMFVGRVLVPSIAKGGAHQLANWMEKLITYETNPGDCKNGGDCAYLTRALYTRSDHMVNSDLIDAQIDALTGWEVFDIKESPVSGDLGTPTGAQVMNEYNKGYGLSSFNNHGDVHSVAVSTTDTNSHPKHWVFSLDEYQGSTDVTPETGNGLDNLIPNGKYSINCSMACHIGAYDREARGESNVICMARAFTTYLADKGGPAMIANTRVGGGCTAFWLSRMLQVLFGHINNNFYPQYPVTNIGVALAGGKHYSYDSTFSYS